MCGVLGHLAPVHRCARLVRCFACAVSSAAWLLFTGVPARCVVLLVRCPEPLGSCSPVCPQGALLCLCGVLGHLSPVHRCACSVRCFACAVSWATWLLFTGVPARCFARVCGVLGHLAPVHRCARSACCFECAVSRATWLLFTRGPARCVVLLVRCPGSLGSCSLMCRLGVLCCVCRVRGVLAPVDRCARSSCCVACAVSSATWLLFTSVPACCVVLLVQCPGPLGPCSPVCPLSVLCCVFGVLGHLAPVHRCARCVCCVPCAVSWVTWLLFTSVPARCVALRVRCPGPLGSCSSMCPLGVLLVCAVSWATWHLFSGLPARCVVLLVRFPGPLGSCLGVCLLGPLLCVCGVLGHLAPVHVVCPLGVLFFLCGVLGHLAPVHRCTRSLRCLCVRCPGPSGSCSPVCPLGALFCLCGVLGDLAPVHQCARSVHCFACAVSWANWLLFTGVLARCVVFLVRCPGPLGSCSTMCPLGVLFFLCGVSGHLALVSQCARSVRCLCVRCPGPLGSSSLVCPLGALFCLCGVLGHLAPVHRCARSVCCVACAVR